MSVDALALHVCPECGSGKIDVGSQIVTDQAPAKCTACGWTGNFGQLIGAVAPATDDLNPDVALGIAAEVSKLYMNMLAQHAGQPIGLAMVQSGVVGVKDSEALTRLIRAACLGAHKATLEEVEVMQKELQDGRRPTN